jgi:hypothetical protein
VRKGPDLSGKYNINQIIMLVKMPQTIPVLRYGTVSRGNP